MHPCGPLIAEIYNHPKVTTLLNRINPPELRADLLQELAVVLLEYDCGKLQQMQSEGKLLAFTRRTMWKMATLPNGKFIRTYRQTKYNELDEDTTPEPEEAEPIDPLRAGRIIKAEMQDKMSGDANEAHEAIIFEKYLECQSCERVAVFFGIPRVHVFRVVKKVKTDLKKKINR